MDEFGDNCGDVEAGEEEQGGNDLDQFMSEIQQRIDWRVALREENAEPAELSGQRLDSSVKKCSAFVRKLQKLGDHHDTILKECECLNLSQYLSEIAKSLLIDARLKLSDLWHVIQLCSICHRRYEEFASVLFETFSRNCLFKKEKESKNAKATPSPPNVVKLRIDIRLLADFISVGIFGEKEGLPVLANQLKTMINHDKETGSFIFLPLLVTFAKSCGYEYADLIPPRIKQLAGQNNVSLPLYPFARPHFQEGCARIINDYFTNGVIDFYTSEFERMKSMERGNAKQLNTHGEIPHERIVALQNMQRDFQKLKQTVEMLHEMLDAPPLPELNDGDEEEAGLKITVASGKAIVDVSDEFYSEVFEDEDLMSFYREVIDLAVYVPAIALKNAEPSDEIVDQTKADFDEEEEAVAMKEAEEGGGGSDIKVDIVEEDETIKMIEEVQRNDDDNDSESQTASVDPSEPPPPPVVVASTSAPLTSSEKPVKFDEFASTLPSRVNKTLIDSAAIDFTMFCNTKNNRKRLSRVLFGVQRTRYDLLPFYARLVATIKPYVPSVAAELNNFLRADFYYHIKKKDQIKIESKLKTVRFIGELVKFEIFPVAECVRCLIVLLKEFQHHNIDMACAMLDCCGRFLFFHPQAHHKIKSLLELMMRKKTKSVLDARYETMIDNAFYATVPRLATESTHQARPAWQLFVDYLLYEQLSKSTSEKTIKQIRKLEWSAASVRDSVIRAISKCWMITFNRIHYLANFLSGLSDYYDFVAVAVLDNVIEELRVSLELVQPQFHQRRVSCAKFLAEMYNYRVADSASIFKMLYSIIMTNVTFDATAPNEHDPPEYLFRIRLICIILETCGQFFDRGPHGKKLDHFLLYFQHYFWYKKSNYHRRTDTIDLLDRFPIDIQNMYYDCFDYVRPKFRHAKCYEDAVVAVVNFEKAFATNIENAVIIEEDEDDYDDMQQRPDSADLTEEAATLSVESSRDDDDEHDEALDGDETTVLDVSANNTKMRHQKSDKDDDFVAQFDQLMVESREVRASDAAPIGDLPLTAALKQQVSAAEAASNNSSEDSMPCMLMVKKGNKQVVSKLSVPRESDIGTAFIAHQEAALREKEEVKQMVLNMQSRQDEEASVKQMPEPSVDFYINKNREKRIYQPPKGVPDTSDIFGGGGRGSGMGPPK